MKNKNISVKECFTKSFINEATKNDSIIDSIMESSGLINVRKAPKDFKVEWHTVESPTRLRKIFELEDTKVLKLFLSELIDYEDEHDHFAKLITEGTNVTIEVNTRDIQTITQLDYEYAEYANDLYSDLMQALYKNMTIEK